MNAPPRTVPGMAGPLGDTASASGTLGRIPGPDATLGASVKAAASAIAPRFQPDVASQFSTRVIAWQRDHGRHALPWQRSREPYRVWLSEIMLQQTQVATVLGYYDRFLARFPDVATLAAAPLDDVLAAWAGLGYYSRARNLHRCAQTVVERHGGSFPSSSAELAMLPGIGRSTAAAIAAFCFGERVAILDGNVKRVLARLLAFEGDLASSASEQALWAHATRLLPETGIDVYTQGLMDLGATLCTAQSPSCMLCPALGLCAAQRAGAVERFPVKSRKLKRSWRESWWLWLECEGHVWLTQRPATGVWAGLWTLPLYDSEASLQATARALEVRVAPHSTIEHALTHLDWVLHPRRAVLRKRPSGGRLGDGRWVPLRDLESVALPAPLKRLLG
jgi:A/G-specific adenine glycosylase